MDDCEVIEWYEVLFMIINYDYDYNNIWDKSLNVWYFGREK